MTEPLCIVPDSIAKSLLAGRLQAALVGFFVFISSAWSLYQQYTVLASDGFTFNDILTILNQAGPFLDTSATLIGLIGGLWVAVVSTWSKLREQKQVAEAKNVGISSYGS